MHVQVSYINRNRASPIGLSRLWDDNRSGGRNGHGDALHLLRIKTDGTTELANSFTYSTWGAPTVLGTHDNSNNGGADYGDLGFRFLYVGEFDVQWDNQFGLDRKSVV